MDEAAVIYVPYANDESEPSVLEVVELNLNVLGFLPRMVKMQHQYSYGEFLNHLSYTETGPFIIVEHDCIPWPGAIQQILGCPEPNCSYGGTLQCAKITPTGHNLVPEKTIWGHCDARLWEGITAHMHLPEVSNINRSNIPR